MSLLSEDQWGELTTFLENDNNAGETAVNSEPDNSEPVVEAAPVAEQATDSQPDVTPEDSSPSDDGHNVPYSRFQSVIHARNDLRSRNEDLERQLQELQNNKPAEQSPSYDSEPSEFDPLYGMEEFDDGYSKKFQTLESRLEEFEVFQEQQKLEKELNYVADRYPTVPREALLSAVINDPNTNIVDAAERYSTFVAQVRESAIADYASQNGVNQRELPPAVPPRVAQAGSSNQNNGFGDNPAPRNLDQAKDALFKFLQNR